jgi:2-polyprenyl-6-methoxyphenol hydroxylase-like FAD-dependent oxidoreductase
MGIRQGDDMEIMRGDLADIFYRATVEGCEYIFGDSIRSIEEVANGVTVYFEHGQPRVFDLVIGADGLHSNVRSLVFGDESQFIKDLGGFYFSIFSVPNSLRLDRWELFYVKVNRVTNLYSIRNGKDAKALFVFNAADLVYDSRDQQAQKAILRKVYGGLKWEVPALLSAMEAASDFYLDAINQIKMPTWHRGRCMLLGDAACAPSLASGQGTSMAIVGAYVLAGELFAAHGDHRVAFPAYESAVRGFMEKNQKLGEHVQQMVPGSGFELKMQAMLLKFLPYLPFTNRVIKKIIKRTYAAANAILLKDY